MEPAGTRASPRNGGIDTATGVPGRYATALYELADERRVLDAVVEQARALAAAIDGSEPLRSVLSDPALKLDEKRDAVLALLDDRGGDDAGGGFDPVMRQFVGTVANNRRLGSLREILRSFAAIVSARRGVVVARVSSAHPLSDGQRAQLRARLAEAGFGRIEMEETVDGSLLGGLVVRVGAQLYDASLKSRLSRLHHAMKGVA